MYVCLECNCLLDESCAEFPSQVKHPFHPQHPLTLQAKRAWKNRCKACGNVLRGRAFLCSECEFGLDICCASLMATKNCEDRELLQIEQFGHPHPLILCEKKWDYPFSCYACKLSLGSSFCVCLQCSNLLHKSCANLPRELHHSPCHNPNHSLTLLEPPSLLLEEPFQSKQHKPNPSEKMKLKSSSRHIRCCSCDSGVVGYAYSCRLCLDYVDIRCAINYKLHDHLLAFFNTKSTKLICKICDRPLHTPFFHCEECNFNLHVSCLPILPQTVKHRTHRHTLTLTKAPVKDHPDEDENAEFYCDACEEYRELSDPTYYCEECHFVAHVHCVVSEALRVLVQEWSLAFEFAETKLYMSHRVGEENASVGVSKTLMIEEMKESHGGANEATTSSNLAKTLRSFGDASLIELDEEIVVLGGELKCLYTEKKDTGRKIEEMETRLEELIKGRRAQYFNYSSSTKQ